MGTVIFNEKRGNILRIKNRIQRWMGYPQMKNITTPYPK